MVCNISGGASGLCNVTIVDVFMEGTLREMKARRGDNGVLLNHGMEVDTVVVCRSTHSVS